jgi:predicted phosphodiesterase
MCIFAVSDLHTDFKANRLVLDELTRSGYSRDTLLVAGDIADRLEVIEDTLALLKSRFAKVFYTPGNHELWVRFDAHDSVAKLKKVIELSERLGIETGPAKAEGVWVVPLFSWYEARFAGGEGADEEELRAWADFYFCKWPPEMSSVSEYFRDLNAGRLRSYEGEVITLSHFLPRRDLLPGVDGLRFKGLLKVAGSGWLDAQVRALNSSVHVFGHSHINCDRVMDGVRYVQNALRYPSERGASVPSLKLIWPPAPAIYGPTETDRAREGRQKRASLRLRSVAS